MKKKFWASLSYIYKYLICKHLLVSQFNRAPLEVNFILFYFILFFF